MIRSYPSVYQLGHKAISGILNGNVVIQEKIDGSQLSLGVIDGELQCRSKGKQLVLGNPEHMFECAVTEIEQLADKLVPGWIYRGEYLEKPKHNTLAYSRTPLHHIILFDIMTDVEDYMLPENVTLEAQRLGLETVPTLFVGELKDMSMLNTFLERESVLGGTKVEGVVIKNYAVFTAEKKPAMAKYVRESFKETNAANQKAQNPGSQDIIEILIDRYHNEARWTKAVQHLRENGQLTESPKDIGPLMKEVVADVLKEEEDNIKAALFKWAWTKIARSITTGLPEWYKQSLAEQAFNSAEGE